MLIGSDYPVLSLRWREETRPDLPERSSPSNTMNFPFWMLANWNLKIEYMGIIENGNDHSHNYTLLSFDSIILK